MIYSSNSIKSSNIKNKIIFLFKDNIVYSDKEADCVISIGGDGTILRLLRKNYKKPIFPINGGSIGFLTNHLILNKNLINIIKKSIKFKLYPLIAKINDELFFAYNEIVIMRSTSQSAKIKIKINQNIVYPELICDGIIISTPCGSTGYNLSAGGSILPLDCNLINLTPICPFRPRNAKSALLNNKVVIQIENNEDNGKRPIKINFDGLEKQIKKGEIINISLSNNYQNLLLNEETKNRIFMENFI